jgi:hypothetical protein
MKVKAEDGANKSSGDQGNQAGSRYKLALTAPEVAYGLYRP